MSLQEKRIVLSSQVTAKKSTAVGADVNEATSKWFMSVLTCARRFENHENPVSKLHQYIGMMQKIRLDFFQRTQTALGFLLPSQPRRFCSRGCSVSSAHGAQTKVTLGSPPDSVKRCQRVSRNSQISKYPPFSPNIPFILDVARFEIQHDACR